MIFLFIGVALAYQSVVIDSQSITSTTSLSNNLLSAPGPQKVKEVDLSVYYPVNSLPPGIHCTLGVALVKAIAINPTIQLVNGQPLVFPQDALIAGQVWEFTSIDTDVQTKNPFIYNSLNDPDWTGLSLNSGNQLRLLTALDCSAPVQVIYSGLFNWK